MVGASLPLTCAPIVLLKCILGFQLHFVIVSCVYRLFLPSAVLTVLNGFQEYWRVSLWYLPLLCLNGEWCIRVLIMVDIATVFCCVTHKMSLMSLYTFLFYLFSRGARATLQLHNKHLFPVLPKLHLPLPIQHWIPHLCVCHAICHVEEHRAQHWYVLKQKKSGHQNTGIDLGSYSGSPCTGQHYWNTGSLCYTSKRPTGSTPVSHYYVLHLWHCHTGGHVLCWCFRFAHIPSKPHATWCIKESFTTAGHRAAVWFLPGLLVHVLVQHCVSV